MPIAPPDAQDLEEAVRWAYRLLLDREPESAEVIQAHAKAHQSVAAIRRAFMLSNEFSKKAAADEVRLPGSEVLSHFPRWTGKGEPGFWYDFLGVKTRCEYFPDGREVLSGTVQGPPGTEQAPLHDVAEWIGTLRSVLEARTRGSLVVVELGAGWGPWLVDAAKAAERVGIRDVHLAGVEGAQSHFDFMLQHFRDNGLDPNAYLLICGVVGSEDGTARFPKLSNPRGEWGAKADYCAEAPSDEPFEAVPCVALTTLLAQLPPVDLIHCDVQGAEHDVLTSARDALQSRVARVVVGTHSRRIEADLLEFFAALGWGLEAEGACRLDQPRGHGFLRLLRDGYQVWANPNRSRLQ